MKTPSFDAMLMARNESDAAGEFEYHNKLIGEISPLKKGDRVYFLTIEGEFVGTVGRDWDPVEWPSLLVSVSLDCKPAYPVEFHRSLFRAFTVLDHIASA